MSDLSLGFSIRIGTITKIGDTRLYFTLTDDFGGNEFEVAKIQPYAGRGGGFFAGFEVGCYILVIKGMEGKWYCVGVVPNRSFYFDLDGVEDARYHETPYPSLKEGEMAIKSSVGSRIDLLNDGNVRIDAGIGLSLSDMELSRDLETLFFRVPNEYSFTEAGRKIEGVVRRDMNLIERPVDTNTLNFLDGERYHELLSDIGRSPGDEAQQRTTKLIKQALRNPSLIEKREIIYEYADSFDVRHFDDEINRTLKDEAEALKIRTANHARQQRRTDILNLNARNFNHLIEKVEGTLVDVYGNILDINRNIIKGIPSATDISQDGNDKGNLKKIYDYHRRGVKLHYEINSRKHTDGSEPPEGDKSKNNAKSFSRWSVDVDGEGLTKINIPASSETGNIPVLGRYFTKRDDEDKEKLIEADKTSDGKDDKDKRDISINQFGAVGPSIDNQDYATGGVSTAGTAYHDIMKVASSIMRGKKGTLGDSGPVMSQSISNKVGNNGGPASGANAGGRSLHANLDGSIEMSVGADTVDRKSMVIDTQGGVISHFGKDNNGRSIIHQSDGDVIMQIGGGTNDTQDDRFPDISQGGRLEIHIARSGGGSPQKILIDESGMTLDVQGNLLLKSSADIGIDAGARLVLHGEMVFIYGKTDIDQRTVVAQETLIVRAGAPQFTWKKLCIGGKVAKYKIEDVREFVKSRDGTLVTKEYTNCVTPLTIVCNKDNYKWHPRWSDIRRGQWCPKCSGKAKRTIEEVRLLVESRDGVLLSKKYKNAFGKMNVKCNKDNYEWETTWHDLSSGYWCSKCAGMVPPTTDEIRGVVESNGGILLPSEYTNCYSRMNIKCKCGHKWSPAWTDVQQGKWCPACKAGKSQKKLKRLLEDILKQKAKMNYRGFGWLIGIQRKQEIDIWFPKIKLAVEYDGIQHFEPVCFGGITKKQAQRKLEYMQKLDNIKNKRIAQHPEDIISFIRFNYTEPLTREYVRSKIIDKL